MGRHVSITLSPIHLILPIFELNAEIRAGDFLGIGIIGGIGQISVENSLGQKEKFSAYELGAQLNIYPLKPFESLHFGIEALYLRVATEDRADTISGVGEGLAIGPMVGYKLITSGGFTFVAQGGVEYVVIQAEAEDSSTGQQAQDEGSRVIPLLNLNLGWSF